MRRSKRGKGRGAGGRRLLLVAGASFLLGCEPAGDAGVAPDAEAASVSSRASEYPDPEGAWEVHRSDFDGYLARARAEGVSERPIGERMTALGAYFVGLPYVAHTLEMAGPERLVVNLKELDCVTLVENALALAHAVRADDSFSDFLARLEEIRYRDGRLDGYTSRLHYFSDWLLDAERKGLVRNVTREIGGEPFEKPIHFMTTNREAYRQLRDDPALVDAMRGVEERLNREELFWIPERRIAEVAPRIREGDIIAITTRIEGLEISHTGLATWVDGRLHLLHAPDVGQPVEISQRPLADRIRAQRQQTGIMVARPLER
jgi:hypothetical protein